jgi:hypothetical protein
MKIVTFAKVGLSEKFRTGMRSSTRAGNNDVSAWLPGVESCILASKTKQAWSFGHSEAID